MLRDLLTTFAEAQATGNTTTGRKVGEAYDLGAAGINIGVGEPVYLNVVVDTGITAGSAGVFAVVLTQAANVALDSGAENILTSTNFVTGTASGTGALKPGTVLLSTPLPSNINYKRYLGIREVVTTQNTTAGKITAFLSMSPLDANKAYPQGSVA
jgi:hypothetical protein